MRFLLTRTQQPYHNPAVVGVNPLAVAMSAVLYNGVTAGDDGADEAPVPCKHPRVQCRIAGAPLEVGMHVIEHEEIGPISRRDRADALPESLGTA